jgi:hypothetical protein
MIVLQIASAEYEHDRYNSDSKAEYWQNLTKASDKPAMLEIVLELLNDEELDVKNNWLRLVEYDENNVVKNVETF